MKYLDLLIESDELGLTALEMPLKANNGRIKGNRIAIRMGLTEMEKKCVLAEELGHYHTTYGDIINNKSTDERKQELKARLWAYDKVIGLYGIVCAYLSGCQSLCEIADFLGVTEEFANEAIDCYKSKYGGSVRFKNYIIYFEPLNVQEG